MIFESLKDLAVKSMQVSSLFGFEFGLLVHDFYVFNTAFVLQTMTKIISLYDNYKHLRADLFDESKGKDKDFKNIYKYKEYT